jgi:protein transport protein SEC31
MDYNTFKPNLIAVGGNEEVLIVNLESGINEPQIFSPGTPNLHEEEGGKICCVAWNKKVAHILASADSNGLTVVWDLKTNKPIFNF